MTKDAYAIVSALRNMGWPHWVAASLRLHRPPIFKELAHGVC